MFIIGSKFRDGHLGTMYGQPPRRDLDVDRRALDRLVSQPPPPWSAERLLAKPVFTTRGAVSDLGLDRAVENEWAGFLQKAVYNSPYEHTMRQQVMERLVREDWDPELRKVMFQRAMSLYRSIDKSMIEVIHPDELCKAKKEAEPKKRESSPRGGMYYRRVPHEAGKGFRYYYDPEKYHARKDAHQSGEHMKKYAMGEELSMAIDRHGPQGCPVKGLERLVKKYGAKALGAELKKQTGENGPLMFAKGKFYRKHKG